MRCVEERRVGESPKPQSQLCTDYCISRHYPALESVATPYPALLETIIIRQAELLVQWQLVGFIHGVMNTDNTALSGETIDYGPRLRTSPSEPSVGPERGA